MLELSMLPTMTLRVTPALLNLAHMLVLPSMDLQQMVQQEIAENPALEEVEAFLQICGRCGSPIIDGLCLACASADTARAPSADMRMEDSDPLLFIAAPRSLSESLLADLYATLPTSEHPIALSLVGNLDDRGFLVETPEDLADLLGVRTERVQMVLQRLRELGPPGIATQTPQECLLAQIEALEDQGITCPYVRRVIRDAFADLGAGRFKQIARRLQISYAEMDAVRAFIRRYLWPYPAQAALAETAPAQRPRYRVADISIVERDEVFSVEVLHSLRRVLRLNPIYQELARTSATLSDAERAHVQEYMSRARTFLSNLRQREVTLQRIGEAIVVRQEAFLRHGVRHLAPMTRSEIAHDIGVHESTVSRAIAEKSILLPDGSLLALSELFIAARGVQDVLREIIANEPRPLSDDDLAGQLRERGYLIARRTVAKYRDLMRIPPSYLR
ncbi:MAG: hypothetical protein HGA65_03175 [Oscillochloris sp.]|nr:hypothetical protein [Oscillochloris sp.]